MFTYDNDVNAPLNSRNSCTCWPQLGLGDTVNRLTPTSVSAFVNSSIVVACAGSVSICLIAIGCHVCVVQYVDNVDCLQFHTCVGPVSGGLICWGQNFYGQVRFMIRLRHGHLHWPRHTRCSWAMASPLLATLQNQCQESVALSLQSLQDTLTRVP